MESQNDLKITLFRIAFNNQLLELNYNPSFEEYKTVTIKSVIEKTLEKIGPKPLTKTSDNYSLICSCGKPFDPEKLISKSKCDHYSYFEKSKNNGEKFLLVEKESNEENPKNKKDEEFLSNYEIAEILMKATGAKKMMVKLKAVPENKKINFTISENLKKVIKELKEKRDRGNRLIDNGYDLKYNEEKYQQLLEIGIEEKKIKAALRMTNNMKEEALLLATDSSFNIDNRDYLYCDNNDVLSNREFNNKCKEEVKKDYPNLFEEEIATRTKIVIKVATKGNNNDGEELNDSDEGLEDSSLNEIEESEEDGFGMGYSESNEQSSEI